MSVTIREYKPSPALSPYVELFWEGHFNVSKAPFASRKVVPNGYLEIIIHLVDAHCELLQDASFRSSPSQTLIGLFPKPYEVHFKDSVRVFGIRLKPEGAYPVLGMPAAEVQEHFADLEMLMGRHFREFTERLREKGNALEMISLSEAYLLKRLDENQAGLYYLNRAAEMIRRRKGLISMEELAEKAYISPRQLEREFKQKIGMTPKGYMRLARLNEVNRLLKNGKWRGMAALAYKSGYADQAHFIRDFKHFTGEKPTVFVKEMGQFIVNPNMAQGASVSSCEGIR